MNWKNHVKLALKDVFGFANYDEKTIFELGYILFPIRNKDNAVLNKTEEIADARIKNDIIY